MSVRTFIFCDGCNPQGIRNICDDDQHDRRNSDGRSWFEGSLDDAIKLDWEANDEYTILCPHCVKNDMAGLLQQDQPGSNNAQLNT